ncbi:type II secretion system F family protein [Micromonospora sp. NBC_01813]|uniref:type II secretion system F family protein n=1 Tax=Micromonospora sp. NBC_01813 TaxID=2975988 RepID=UPI002DD9BF8E|nr:type II secretion system F family protein [Micromonospora sp. NBC_01813]WSA06963.1 type II secretion system F family protein [Micromonospora sp. NBC_01813]
MIQLIVIGALLGAALAWLVTSMAPRRLSVAEALDAVRRPPAPPLAGMERAQHAVAAPLYQLRLPRAQTLADLAILERDPTSFLVTQLGLAALGLFAPTATVAGLNLMGAGIGWGVPLVLSVLLAAGGYVVAELSVREEADQRRLLMRYTIAALLDVVPTSLAAGAGIEQAMTSTSRNASGWAARRIRDALAHARDNHIPIAQALQELGEQTGVVELEQLAGSLHLAAGEGSRIREALIQRGASLSDRLIADLEAKAEAATERMSVPLMALTSLFLLALIYPAMAAFQSGA